MRKPRNSVHHARFFSVCCRPKVVQQGAVGQARMKHHAYQHGKRPQIIHIGQALRFSFGRTHKNDVLRRYTQLVMTNASTITANWPANIAIAGALHTILLVLILVPMASNMPMPAMKGLIVVDMLICTKIFHPSDSNTNADFNSNTYSDTDTNSNTDINSDSDCSNSRSGKATKHSHG